MASYPTKPAYIMYCSGWEERVKEHPVFDWMADHEEAFDFGTAKSDPYTKWFTSDFTFVDSTGKTTKGADAWQEMLALYAPFSGHFHEPFFGVIFETETGFELIGCAKIFANLAKEGDGEKKKDGQGREWDLEAPGAFHFTYVRDESGPKGLKLSSERLYADKIPVVGAMLKRGMVTVEDFMKQAAA
jgi:hypothetical protein